MIMKKLIPFVLIIIVAVIVASCTKRDYVCACTENHGGTFSKHNYDLGHVNENTAQNACSDKQLSLSNGGAASSCYVTF
jgi:hypothetical protein